MLLPTRADVRVDGGGVTLQLRLAPSAARPIRRALERGRPPTAVVTLVATDLSGNAAGARLRVRLQR